MNVSLWTHEEMNTIGQANQGCPSMTLYPVSSGKPAPVVVVCPGGGYRERASHEGEPIARWLNGIGIAAVVLDYRVAPYKHPVPLGDAQRAIRKVRLHAEEWGFDANRVGILGFSAGGHLASSVGTHYDKGKEDSDDPIDRHSCRPDLMVLCYPVITLGSFTHSGSLLNLLGENPAPALLYMLSNETQITKDTPPTFLWHTADDPVVPVENSLMFASQLSLNKIPFELHVFESGAHGLGLAEGSPEVRAWSEVCGRWLKKQGF
ncbi:Acetyl esterase/lipase [Paenibacillus sp. GP183]|nr:Acetyl esterase/lipase [Paenibacillus sp. GP183]